MTKKTLLMVLIAFSSFLGKAQDEYTIAHSNYAPTKTFLHNPTNTLDNKVWLDIHIVSAGAFAHNNYAYLPKEEFSLFKNVFGGQAWPPFQFRESTRRKWAYLDTDVQLLSGAFQYKEHGFALSVRGRAMVDFRRIDPTLAGVVSGQTSDPTDFGQEHEANKMFVNHTGMAEFALSYSNMFYHKKKTSMAWGATGKYLMGITGAALKVDEAAYSIHGNTETDFVALNGDMGYAAPQGGISSGKGAAVDLGFVYKRTLGDVTYYEPFSNTSRCKPYGYKFKLSAALIDLGFIRFNQNATKYEVESNITAESFSTNEFDNLGDFINGGLATVSETPKFNMYTPVALNLMADYNFENNFYASAQVTHGLFRRYSFGVQRPDVWTISGRYQRRWFEGSASLALYEYSHLRMGLGLRFAYFTIGTDNLLSYFGVQDFYGTDLYFNLRFFFGKNPRCGKKAKGRKLNPVKCVKN